MTRVDWPRGFPRTGAGDRERNNSFRVSLATAFDDLETELNRLGVDEDGYRYSFDAQQRQTDQRPYARANPDDPGFALRWKMDGAQYAVACDAYTALRDNVRAIGLYLREKRKMEKRPVETGESEFANARLPPADKDIVVANSVRGAHDVLNVAPDASDDEVRAAYRERVKDAHPDNGGSDREFQRVRDAKEAMLGE
ncbi:J domain-containing protein [Halobacterium zhouii]|uniref:J domain-containing protein n=1 Tax=Halobacterium zhouii TaxID=2902624 RepID=UPI001E3E62BA|nr:J domain-containing protein [Halobacterium zhouii]